MPKGRSQVYSRYLRGREVGHRRSLCLAREPLKTGQGVLTSAVVERLYRDFFPDLLSVCEAVIYPEIMGRA